MINKLMICTLVMLLTACDLPNKEELKAKQEKRIILFKECMELAIKLQHSSGNTEKVIDSCADNAYYSSN